MENLTNTDWALIFVMAIFIIVGVIRLNKDSRLDNALVAFGVACFALAAILSPLTS